jgi:hypothetical protein
MLLQVIVRCKSVSVDSIIGGVFGDSLNIKLNGLFVILCFEVLVSEFLWNVVLMNMTASESKELV